MEEEKTGQVASWVNSSRKHSPISVRVNIHKFCMYLDTDADTLASVIFDWTSALKSFHDTVLQCHKNTMSITINHVAFDANPKSSFLLTLSILLISISAAGPGLRVAILYCVSIPNGCWLATIATTGVVRTSRYSPGAISNYCAINVVVMDFFFAYV